MTYWPNKKKSFVFAIKKCCDESLHFNFKVFELFKSFDKVDIFLKLFTCKLQERWNETWFKLFVSLDCCRLITSFYTLFDLLINQFPISRFQKYLRYYSGTFETLTQEKLGSILTQCQHGVDWPKLVRKRGLAP